jgi:hypothetical protein
VKKSRILKLSTLSGLKACVDQVALFWETFGESVRVTEELCLSVSDKFDWMWAAENLLSAPAWAEYKRLTDLARAEHERVRAPEWAEYKRITARALVKYERVRARAWAEQELAQVGYERVRALAFARGYLS